MSDPVMRDAVHWVIHNPGETFICLIGAIIWLGIAVRSWRR